MEALDNLAALDIKASEAEKEMDAAGVLKPVGFCNVRRDRLNGWVVDPGNHQYVEKHMLKHVC